MKPENLIKIAHYHSLYGESNLYTMSADKKANQSRSSVHKNSSSVLEMLTNWTEQYYVHGNHRNWWI
ncbi:MAG: hypothetical protein HQM13_21250 [SAR324 cluster bacterium]|nr:hypothetical protein [SAR324 cluster bacterium]